MKEIGPKEGVCPSQKSFDYFFNFFNTFDYFLTHALFP